MAQGWVGGQPVWDEEAWVPGQRSAGTAWWDHYGGPEMLASLPRELAAAC